MSFNLPDETKRKAETLYRSGALTKTQICRRLNISAPTLYRWAKQYHWKQDLKAAVIERAQRIIAEENLTAPEIKNSLISRNPTNDEILDELATEQVDVIKKHKATINDMMNTSNRIQEHVKSTLDAYDDQRKTMPADDAFTLSKTQHQLASAQYKMIDADRKTHNLDEATDKANVVLIELNI